MAKNSGNTRGTRRYSPMSPEEAIETFQYGTDYELNEYLRNPSSAHNNASDYNYTDDDRARLNNLARSLSQAFSYYPLERNTYYRGVDFDNEQQYNTFMSMLRGSGTYTDNGFSFITKDRSEAISYANRQKRGVLLQYEGVEALPLSDIQGEEGSASEGSYIIDKGKRLRVSNIRQQGNTTIIILR